MAAEKRHPVAYLSIRANPLGFAVEESFPSIDCEFFSHLLGSNPEHSRGSARCWREICTPQNIAAINYIAHDRSIRAWWRTCRNTTEERRAENTATERPAVSQALVKSADGLWYRRLNFDCARDKINVLELARWCGVSTCSQKYDDSACQRKFASMYEHCRPN